MSKIIIAYGSTTGNTGTLSEYIADTFKQAGLDVVNKEVTGVKAEDLTGFEVVVLGSSTWGIGELQDDMIDLYDSLGSVSLSGKKAAVFGPGDSDGYPDSFCTAVDLLEEKLKESGAELVVTGLKVDGEVDSAKADSEAWASKVIAAVS